MHTRPPVEPGSEARGHFNARIEKLQSGTPQAHPTLNEIISLARIHDLSREQFELLRDTMLASFAVNAKLGETGGGSDAVVHQMKLAEKAFNSIGWEVFSLESTTIAKASAKLTANPAPMRMYAETIAQLHKDFPAFLRLAQETACADLGDVFWPYAGRMSESGFTNDVRPYTLLASAARVRADALREIDSRTAADDAFAVVKRFSEAQDELLAPIAKAPPQATDGLRRSS